MNKILALSLLVCLTLSAHAKGGGHAGAAHAAVAAHSSSMKAVAFLAKIRTVPVSKIKGTNIYAKKTRALKKPTLIMV